MQTGRRGSLKFRHFFRTSSYVWSHTWYLVVAGWLNVIIKLLVSLWWGSRAVCNEWQNALSKQGGVGEKRSLKWITGRPWWSDNSSRRSTSNQQLASRTDSGSRFGDTCCVSVTKMQKCGIQHERHAPLDSKYPIQAMVGVCNNQQRSIHVCIPLLFFLLLKSFGCISPI